MATNEYFYVYRSRPFWMREEEQADALHAQTPNSWIAWNYDTGGESYGYVKQYLPAHPITENEWTSTRTFFLDEQGYGTPVYIKKYCRLHCIGHAYVTYPRSPGVAAYYGQLMWPRDPGSDPAFQAPTLPRYRSTTRSCSISLSVPGGVFRGSVRRVGDPCPEIGDFTRYADYITALNNVNAHFELK